MAMSLKITGLDEFELKLDKLERGCTGIAKLCLYEGAKVVADNLRAAVGSIPTEAHHAVPNARNGYLLSGMTPEEKAACLGAIGVAKFDGATDNFTTAIGFDGYQTTATSDRHPHGIPVPMLMRSIESGSSVRMKNPVCRKAFKGSESAALAAMQAKFDELINKNMK